MLKPITSKPVSPLRANNHPCQNFIKYLLLLDMFSFEDIEKNILSMGFPPLPIDYLENLNKGLSEKPKDFDCDNLLHKPTVEYLKSLGIYNLFKKDQYTNEALGYLTHVDLKPFIEKSLLANTPPKEIAKRANSKFGCLISAKGIQRYKHYFWNVNIVKIEDWSRLLSNFPEKNVLLHFIRNGPSAVLHHLGFRQRIEIKEALKEMTEIAYDDMKQLKYKSASLDKVKSMEGLKKIFIDIENHLSSEEKVLRDTLEDFKEWRMGHIATNIPAIEEVAELHAYTDSGIKLDAIESKNNVENAEYEDA